MAVVREHMTLSTNSHVGITMEEWNDIKVSALPNAIYNRIERKFRIILGDKAKKFMESHANKTLREISVIQLVNVMDCFYIM